MLLSNFFAARQSAAVGGVELQIRVQTDLPIVAARSVEQIEFLTYRKNAGPVAVDVVLYDITHTEDVLAVDVEGLGLDCGEEKQ